MKATGTRASWILGGLAVLLAGSTANAAERLTFELTARGSAIEDGVWGQGSRATMRIGVDHGETGTIMAHLGRFDERGTPQPGSVGVRGTTGADRDRRQATRMELLGRHPHVWEIHVHPEPARIGEVAFAVEWVHWTAMAPGRAERKSVGERRVVLPEGTPHLLDALVGDEGAIHVLELSARVEEDPRHAGRRLRYELWYTHEGSRSGREVRRAQLVAGQGEEVVFELDPLRFPLPVSGARREAVLAIVGRLQGRIRDDASIEVLVNASRKLGVASPGEPATAWGSTGYGGKTLSVEPGEPIAIVLPEPRGVGTYSADGSSSAYSTDAVGTGIVQVADGDLTVDYRRLFAGDIGTVTLTVRPVDGN